jgi:chaperone LolA
MGPSAGLNRAQRRSALRSLLCGIALLAVASTLLPAARADALAQLRQFASSTSAARGEFSQRVVRSTGQAGASTSGVFSFQRPGRFRWEVQKPHAQIIVADGTTLTLFDPDLNQATLRKLDAALGSTPAALLFGSGDLDSAFTLKPGQTKDGVEWLEATPRDKDSGYERIGIGLRAGAPVAMEIRDAFGQVTLITFTRIERNPELPPETFKFVPPKGADVIRQD